MAQLGRAKSVKVAKENTVIVDGSDRRQILQTVLHRSVLRLRRQNLISTERSFRKVLQNCLAV